MNQTKSATTEGTANYKDRFAGVVADDHFRPAQNLWMSSIGLGSYLGEADERTDAAYYQAVKRAANLGCNVFDAAANYRFQRSERSIGEALTELFAQGVTSRDEIIITTKGGYLPFDGHAPRSRQEMMNYLEKTFVEPGICNLDDFVQGSHCMTPRYLDHQLSQSLANLKLDCIDVYYLHNPESQLVEVTKDDFYKRLQLAFEFLESAVAAGSISMYGTATWNGYRASPNNREFMSLEKVVNAAREVAGDDHHFKVVQLPVNLAMNEAFTKANQPINNSQATLLEAAADLGVTVMASASILQAQLSSGLPPMNAQSFQKLRTDAQRAIQFVRSTPGVDVALVGMSKVAHVEENLELAKAPRATEVEYLDLFGATAS